MNDSHRTDSMRGRLSNIRRALDRLRKRQFDVGGNGLPRDVESIVVGLGYADRKHVLSLTRQVHRLAGTTNP